MKEALEEARVLDAARGLERGDGGAAAALPLSGLAELFELAPDAMLGVQPDGSIGFANRAADEMFGFAPGGLVGHVLEELLPERVRAAHVAERARYDALPRRREMGALGELTARRADGGELAVEVSLAPIRTVCGVLTVAAVRDVTGRRDAQRRAARRSRVQAMLAAANEAIVQAASPAELYVRVCESLASVGGFALSWIGLVAGDVLVPAAAAGRAAGALSSAVSLAQDGPMAAALRAEHPIATGVDDGAGPPATWRERMLGEHVRSACALPLVRGDELVGGLSVWSDEERSFDDDHLAALEQLAANLSFALERMAQKAMQAEAARLGQLALRVPSLQVVFEEVVRSVARLAPVASCWLAERLEDGSLVVRARSGSTAPDGEGAGQVTRVAIEGAESDLGELAVVSRTRRAPGSDERAFLRILATTVAAAMERARVETEMAHLALHDPLTGLPNRTLLFDRLEGSIARSESTGDGLAVLFIDIDHFKFVNDAFGHSYGDRLLAGVVARLLGAAGPRCTVARIGGDEFAVVREQASADDAAALASRIARELAVPFTLEHGPTVVTVSVGVALARPGARAEDLLREADSAMYAAKAHGRNRCTFFDEAMSRRAVQRVELASGLRRALRRSELRAYYQPIHSLRGGVVGVEALARWHHPDHGIVTPNEFIPLAEETGLIVDLGDWMFETACAQTRAWRTIPALRHLSVAVNVSAVQLAEGDLPARVAEILRRHRLAPGVLQVEVTETALMEDTAQVVPTLQALRDLGVRVAIDDFGTGYSSLLYLSSFPVDTIKIDRAFVQGIGTRSTDLAIVRSVTELAHVLDLETVAEGVERSEQLEALRSLGCDMAQGYLWSPPLCATDAERVLVHDVAPSGPRRPGGRPRGRTRSAGRPGRRQSA